MAEKMLAKASGNEYVQPGEVVFAKVDLAMSHDAIDLPRANLQDGAEHHGAGGIFPTNWDRVFHVWNWKRI